MLSRIARRIRRELNRPHWGDSDKLHLGCGTNRLAGWLNVGIPGDIAHDLRKPLPIPDGSVRFIYSEHFIEHITPDEALIFFRECRRVLAPSGVMRVSTPDLRALASEYLAGRASSFSDEFWQPATPCRMLNEALRLWGHQFVYDFDELDALLRKAGFTAKRVAWHESESLELRDLEFRPSHQDLIVEAR
jgi:predicted SAM-dependent methyltransferase